MARTVRDANLESRTARTRLKSNHKPYWRAIDPGRHLGYYKGTYGGKWLARLYVGDGKYREKRLGTADDVQDADSIAVLTFSEAQEHARDWFRDEARSQAGPTTNGSYTVAEAMNDYLAWYAVHRKSLVDVRHRINAFILPELGKKLVSKLTKREIRLWHEKVATFAPRKRTKKGEPQQYRAIGTDADYQRRRKYSANKVLTILKASLNRAWHEDIVSNPEAWQAVKPFPGVDKPRVRYLSQDESVRLVNACDSDFRDVVQAALLTGCRYGELAAFLVEDFDANSKTVHVRESKSGKPRHVPLSDEGIEFFDQMTVGRKATNRLFVRADGAPWGQSHQGRRLAGAAQRAEINDVSFNILRHTYGSALAMKGVPITVIAYALGHADTRVTERHYAALAPSYVAETIRASLPPLGILPSSNVKRLRRKRKN